MGEVWREMKAVGPGEPDGAESNGSYYSGQFLYFLVNFSVRSLLSSNHAHSVIFFLVLHFIVTHFCSSFTPFFPVPAILPPVNPLPLLFFRLLSLHFLLFAFNPPFCPFPSLQLIASNMEGKSSPSEVLVCTTNPDKPGPPSTPCVTAATPYGFTVTWGKDTHPHVHTDRWTHSVIHKNCKKYSKCNTLKWWKYSKLQYLMSKHF